MTRVLRYEAAIEAHSTLTGDQREHKKPTRFIHPRKRPLLGKETQAVCSGQQRLQHGVGSATFSELLSNPLDEEA
jgi:hypothetical protein